VRHAMQSQMILALLEKGAQPLARPNGIIVNQRFVNQAADRSPWPGAMGRLMVMVAARRPCACCAFGDGRRGGADDPAGGRLPRKS
jgi:hypothetical protein